VTLRGATAAALERRRILIPLFMLSATCWILLTQLQAMDMARHDQPHLSGGLASLPLMLGAMMLPLLDRPLLHVRARSFSRRRARSALLFLAGYFLVWTAAETLLANFADRMSGLPTAGAFAVILAILWQCAPAKQVCLTQCHSRAPLAAFGWRADRDAFVFGAAHGCWCAGSCWALMLVPLTIGASHFGLMAGVAIWMLAERLESPAPPEWQVRFPTKAVRILIHGLRTHGAPGQTALASAVLYGERPRRGQL